MDFVPGPDYGALSSFHHMTELPLTLCDLALAQCGAGAGMAQATSTAPMSILFGRKCRTARRPRIRSRSCITGICSGSDPVPWTVGVDALTHTHHHPNTPYSNSLAGWQFLKGQRTFHHLWLSYVHARASESTYIIRIWLSCTETCRVHVPSTRKRYLDMSSVSLQALLCITITRCLTDSARASINSDAELLACPHPNHTSVALAY